MKKLIAISVVFALVLGAAFAQPSMSGNFKVGVPLLKGQSENKNDDAEVNAGGVRIESAHLGAGFGDANAGGTIRFYHNTDAPQYQPVFAFAWWRPIPQVRIQLGNNPDGDFGFGDIAGWSFDAEAKAAGVAINTYADLPDLSNIAESGGEFPGGFGGWGLLLSLYPIDGLQVNLGIPFGGQGGWGGGDTFEAIYSNLTLMASYIIEDIGKVGLTVNFKPGSHNRYVFNSQEVSGEKAPATHWRGNEESHDPMSFALGFALTAIEGLGAEIGVTYTLPYTTQDVLFKDNADKVTFNVGGIGLGESPDFGDPAKAGYIPVNTKVNTPVKLGLGAKFGAGDFNVKARAAFHFAGSKAVDTGKAKKLEAEREALLKDGKDAGHIPGQLYLGSSTFYQKYTDTDGDVYWQARYGTQEKQADPFQWGVNLLPSYKLGNVTVFLGLGMGMKHYAKQTVKTEKRDSYGDVVTDANGIVYETVTFEGKPGLYTKETNINVPTKLLGKDVDGKDVYGIDQAAVNALNNKLETIKVDMDFYINPYVQIPAGGGSFYAGFKFFTDGTRIPVKFNYGAGSVKGLTAGAAVDSPEYDDVTAKEPKPVPLMSTKYRVKWEIPIGFNFYF